MITLTKEWLLKTISELEEERDSVPGAVNEDAAMALAAMKLALESLEAEKERKHHSVIAEQLAHVLSGLDATDHQRAVISCAIDRLNNVAEILQRSPSALPAPPAPVSVPDEMEMDDDFDSAFEHGKAVGWNAYRAAMLQGAEPVTTDYKLPFDQWLSQQTGTIDVECGCVMTEVFFHWLRVAYEAGNYPVIPDGWKLVPIDPTKDMLRAGQSVVGFWLNTVHCYSKMLAAAPAAPQQEVNNG
ncbi:hypothetical protein [Atlantibacter hermannii]|uniref:hypothetical protein n=1 Tax=Atlantibacter hermannii TaxID=565 RepID=UPI0028A78D44|nr:hypothetical protein [Atlantibacter hermannii]